MAGEMALSCQKVGTYRRQCVARMVSFTQLRTADVKSTFFDAFLLKRSVIGP